MPKSPRFPPNAVHVIEVLAFPSVQLLDVTGPLQVFATANDHVAAAGGTPPYAIRVVARGSEGVETSAGLGLAAGPLRPGASHGGGGDRLGLLSHRGIPLRLLSTSLAFF